MTRLPYLETSDLAAQDQDVLQRPFRLWRTLANAPAASRQFQAMVGHLWQHSGLPRRQVELAILQVGYVTRAEYEWVHHIRLGLQNGLEPRDIAAIGEETAGRATHLPEADRLILRAAREMTPDGELGDATFDALRTHFDHELLLNLLMTISFYNGVSILLKSLQIEAEDEYRSILAQYPFPSH
ncbi:MAG: carboxymuconolactone decarboxylase family protein [Burkholderiaceae bacterium]